MTARQQALEFFIRQGWTPPQAAGIVANLEAESGWYPNAVGDGGAAHGLAQWHQPRPRRGESITGSTFEQQLQYVDDELRAASGATDESRAAFLLAQCDTAARSAAVFCEHYERPADIPGESAKRGALAERIYADYGGTSEVSGAPPMPSPASPPPSDAAATPSPPPEQPMPAILATLLPSVLQLFAPRAQAALGKITGQPADVLNPFLQQLFAQIGQATGSGAVQTDAQAIAAAAALQKAPPEIVRAVESHALDYLDKIAPLFDRLTAAVAAENAARLAGLDAAAVRQKADITGSVPILVHSAAQQSWAILGGLAFMVVLAMGCKAVWPDMPDYVTMLVGMFGMAISNAQSELKAIVAYFFDGTPASNADALRDSITAAERK